MQQIHSTFSVAFQIDRAEWREEMQVKRLTQNAWSWSSIILTYSQCNKQI